MRLYNIALFFEDSSAPFTPEDFLKKLFPNFWSWLINFLALIVLFIAVYFLAYKPIKKYINARKDYIEHNLRDSETAKEINERKVKESESLITNAKVEANEIIKKAKDDASKQASLIVEEAKLDALKKQKDADISIKKAEEKSKEKIQKEIVNVAMDATKKVLQRDLKEDDERRFIEQFVKDVSEEEDNV